MALPITLPDTPETVFNKITNTAQGVLYGTNTMRAAIANPVNAENLISLYATLHGAMVYGNSVAGMLGLSDYAKTAMNDPDYDIIASFGATVVAGQAVTEWLLANLPSDGNGGFICFTKQEDGSIVRVPVQPAVLAPLVPLLDALIASLQG